MRASRDGLFGNKGKISTNDDQPERYAINMLWLNKTLNNNQKYICPCNSENELKEKYLLKAAKWKIANPDSQVNFWYDSNFSSKAAVLATQAVLDSDPNLAHVKLRDIQDIGIVKNNPDAFSNMVPIYARVDLLKLILCVNSIENENNQSAIFSDLDIGKSAEDKDQLNKNELFNSKIMEILSKCGFLLGKDCSKNGTQKVENQFIQILDKPETLTAFKLTIDASLMRIIFILNMAHRENNIRILSALDSGTVYYATKLHLHKLIFGLMSTDENKQIYINLNPFESEENAKWVLFDPIKHGCLPLGNVYQGSRGGSDYLLGRIKDGNLEMTSNFIRIPSACLIEELSRDDLDSKSGSSHIVDMSEIEKKALDGRNEYECALMLPIQDSGISPSASLGA